MKLSSRTSPLTKDGLEELGYVSIQLLSKGSDIHTVRRQPLGRLAPWSRFCDLKCLYVSFNIGNCLTRSQTTQIRRREFA